MSLLAFLMWVFYIFCANFLNGGVMEFPDTLMLMVFAAGTVKSCHWHWGFLHSEMYMTLTEQSLLHPLKRDFFN